MLKLTLRIVFTSYQNTQAIDPRRLRFLFKKQLQNSDVNSLRRMVLPKKAAESHLPPLEIKEGMTISMDDIDGSHVWTFKYRFWPNNKSRMYVLENTGDFVNIHQLEQGDFIMVYQDAVNLNYVIRGKKASEHDIDTNGASDDHERCTDGWNELSWMNPLPPPPQMSTFVYDTSFFEDDSPFEFLGSSNSSSSLSSTRFKGYYEDILSLDDFAYWLH
ncbi:hypothetical protein V2J09_015798 [Rumex salicifolius]